MRLLLDGELMDRIRRHARDSYPEECCGVLIGHPAGDRGETTVRELVAAENTREAAARGRRFLIDPQVILQTTRRAREKGLEIVGYYHSHPDHPAVPSEFDREHAWPATSYLIVSVRGGVAQETRSWRLRADRTGYEEEAVEEGLALDRMDSSVEEQTEETRA